MKWGELVLHAAKNWWKFAVTVVVVTGLAGLVSRSATAADATANQIGAGKALTSGSGWLEPLSGKAADGMVCLDRNAEAIAVRSTGTPGEYLDAEDGLYHVGEILVWPNQRAAFEDGFLMPAFGRISEALAAYPLGQVDRWRSRPAFLVKNTGSGPRLVQADLLAEGRAVFMPQLSAGPCAKALRQVEQLARQTNAGLWGAVGRMPVHSAAVPGSMLGDAGNYAIVRGRVVSLGKTRSTRYLNFGGYWKEDFTVTLTAADAGTVLAGLAQAGWSFDELDGRAVEIRGVIEVRDGPLISWRYPEQLVVLEEKRAGRDGQNQD